MHLVLELVCFPNNLQGYFQFAFLLTEGISYCRESRICVLFYVKNHMLLKFQCLLSLLTCRIKSEDSAPKESGGKETENITEAMVRCSWREYHSLQVKMERLLCIAGLGYLIYSFCSGDQEQKEVINC